MVDLILSEHLQQYLYGQERATCLLVCFKLHLLLSNSNLIHCKQELWLF